MLTLPLIEKIIKETPSEEVKSGSCASFIRVAEGNWGIKFYNWEDTARQTHRLQQRAALLGLAPQVGPLFCIKGPYNNIWGYTTLCVETLSDKYNLIDPEDISSSEFGEDYNNLCVALIRAGIGDGDMHGGNVGLLPYGRLVAIDFDLSEYGQ